MVGKYTVNSVSRDNIIDSVHSVDSNEEDKIHRKIESDAQLAINETGFGKYNYKIIAVSGMIAMNVDLAITSIGFILPSAACDFNMSTVDKGRLNASPLLGMLCGSFMWGYIADTKGRRKVLLNCLFIQAIFDCLASIISSYWGFIVSKFITGLALSGQMAVLYTYLGEFQPESQRKKALSYMEIPCVLGSILSPIIAWIILPLTINLASWMFFFKSWNLFIVTCSLPAFFSGFILLRFPETPKYLAESGRNKDLRNVLTAMYRENTGNTAEEYIAKVEKSGITFLTDRSNDSTLKDVKKQKNVMTAFHQFFKSLYEQTKMLLKPPYIGRTIMTCLGSFFIFSSLYALLPWFPELFHRFVNFEQRHSSETANICTISQSVAESLKNEVNRSIANLSLMPMSQITIDKAEIYCDSTIATQVYVHTIILGLSCVPAAIIFLIWANQLGFRLYFVFDSFACGAVTIALFFVTTSTQNLILSCIFEALMSICITVVFCIPVELFPTNLRVTGSALASLFGRIGSFVGNTIFTYLIDNHCLVLISIVAIQLFLAGILGFFMTSDNDHKLKKWQQKTSDVPEVGLAHSDTSKYHSSITNTGI